MNIENDKKTFQEICEKFPKFIKVKNKKYVQNFISREIQTNLDPPDEAGLECTIEYLEFNGSQLIKDLVLFRKNYMLVNMPKQFLGRLTLEEIYVDIQEEFLGLDYEELDTLFSEEEKFRFEFEKELTILLSKFFPELPLDSFKVAQHLLDNLKLFKSTEEFEDSSVKVIMSLMR